MLSENEIRFLEKELTKNGVIFESVQHILDTNIVVALPHYYVKGCKMQ
jgi:hypothetical protein